MQGEAVLCSILIASSNVCVGYRIRFNFCGVKLSRFASFRRSCVFTFAVAESQAREIKPCVSFCRVKLLQMVAAPRKP